MRLPNGYGSVFRLSNHKRRRCPYCARITTGYNGSGHPIYCVVGYYSTREEGINALAAWHKEPKYINRSGITLAEAAEKCFEREKNHLAQSTMVVYRNIFNKHLIKLGKMRVADIKIDHVQSLIDDTEKITVQAGIRNVYHLIEDYCMRFELIPRAFAQYLRVKEYQKKSVRVVFSKEEIATVWQNISEPICQLCIVLLYTGLRIEELLKLKRENIYLEQGYIIAGSKTKAGRNRMIPISERIMPIFVDKMQKKELKIPFSDTNFRKNWERLCLRFSVRHVPHECRHTFRSELDRLGANKVCIDRLMGHVSPSIGEDIYTHKTFEELKKTIELLTY